jgi:hypothetical protein
MYINECSKLLDQPIKIIVFSQNLCTVHQILVSDARSVRCVLSNTTAFTGSKNEHREEKKQHICVKKRGEKEEELARGLGNKLAIKMAVGGRLLLLYHFTSSDIQK